MERSWGMMRGDEWGWFGGRAGGGGLGVWVGSMGRRRWGAECGGERWRLGGLESRARFEGPGKWCDGGSTFEREECFGSEVLTSVAREVPAQVRSSASPAHDSPPETHPSSSSAHPPSPSPSPPSSAPPSPSTRPPTSSSPSQTPPKPCSPSPPPPPPRTPPSLSTLST